MTRRPVRCPAATGYQAPQEVAARPARPPRSLGLPWDWPAFGGERLSTASAAGRTRCSARKYKILCAVHRTCRAYPPQPASKRVLSTASYTAGPHHVFRPITPWQQGGPDREVSRRSWYGRAETSAAASATRPPRQRRNARLPVMWPVPCASCPRRAGDLAARDPGVGDYRPPPERAERRDRPALVAGRVLRRAGVRHGQAADSEQRPQARIVRCLQGRRGHCCSIARYIRTDRSDAPV